jgi:hypothetical protein
MKRFNKEGKLLAKHEMIKIESLMGKNEQTPAFLINRTPDPIKDKFGVKGGKKLPERIIITGVGYNKTTNNAQVYYNITYYSKENGYKYYGTTSVLPNFEVAKLTGTSKRYLLLKYSKCQLNSLSINLCRITSMIGSDPEIFVVDDKDELIPAFDFLKAKTDKNRDKVGTCGVYWDGFQAEFETKPECCLAFHTDSIQAMLTKTLEAARRYNKKAKLSLKTVMDIPQKLLQESATEHVSLGCMPSKNVYADTKALVVPDARKLETRSTGGHIHFDLRTSNTGKADFIDKIPQMVKALDAVLGVSCVAMFNNYDNPERRKYYGRAGEYRTPIHGLEYRTLSNAWLAHPFIMNVVFDIARVTLSLGYYDYMKLWIGTEEEIVNIINNCDVDKAKVMMRRNKSILLSIYKTAYGNITDAQQQKLFDVFYNGMENYIANPEDIEKNWCIQIDKTQLENTANNALQNAQWVRHGEAAGKNFNKGIKIIELGIKIA